MNAAIRDLLGDEAPILVDQEGGRVARLRAPLWPQCPPAALFEDLPESAARANAALHGLMCREAGFDVVCAPVLDLRLPGAHAVIGDRAFSDRPEEVARLGLAWAEGLQQAGCIPVMKHVPGHGRALVDSHLDLPRVLATSAELALDCTPFAALAGIAAWAMTAHIVYEAWDADLPATLSPRVIGEVIRGAIGFPGILVSDDLCMKALRGEAGALARQSLAAGCDLVLHCNGDLAEGAALLRDCPPLTARLPNGSPPPVPGCSRPAKSWIRGFWSPRGMPSSRPRRDRYPRLAARASAAVCVSVLAITLHEAAHGYAALCARRRHRPAAGRLSLNPLRHVDRVGTVLVPGVLLVGQLLTLGRVEFMFGWAKPVPVDLRALANPRVGMMLVAAAGPAMNFALAMISGLLVHPLVALDGLASRDLLLAGAIHPALDPGQPRPRPVQPAAHPAAGWRADRRRAAATGLGAAHMRLERWGILIVIFGVFLLPRLAPGYDPVGWALQNVVTGPSISCC